MRVNWQLIHAARNSYAVLYAACEKEGFILNPVRKPAADVTCYSLNSLNAPAFYDEIASADCMTIVGGPHASACPKEVATYADYVIVGEGEYTLPRLLAQIKAGAEYGIPGVFDAKHYEPADTSVILDSYPAFSQMKGYIEISRGCPFSCGYCQTPQIFGHCMRHRSIDAIVKYADRYEHGRFVSPNAFAYGSDGIHPKYEKIEHLFCQLKNQIFFGTFPSEVRPEFICDESLSLIDRYCANTKLHFGAQSGSNAVLERLHRRHTVQDVVCAVELCREYGIIPIVDFILGLPFETDDDQRETGNLIRWIVLQGTVHVHRFIPLFGTPLAKTSARSILPEIEKLCGNLALRGKLTGSWSKPEIRFFRHPSNDIP